MVSIRQQMVEGGGIGEGGVLPHRGVEVLLMAVGAEGGRVEGNQCRAAGLGVPDAFDGGMHGGDLVFPPGHQALHLHGVLAAAVLIPLPGFPDGGILLGVAAIHPEKEIRSGGNVLKLPRKSRMLRCTFRLPGVEEGQDRPGNGRIHTVQNAVMQCGGRREALPAPLGLSLLIHAEEIGGVIPEEVRRNAHRALDSCRKLHFLRPQNGFLSGFHRLQDRNDLRQCAVSVQTQGKADPRGGPAGGGDISPPQQILIVPGQGLQDHPLTSLLSGGGTVMTPFTRPARKNFGVMFSGSR